MISRHLFIPLVLLGIFLAGCSPSSTPAPTNPVTTPLPPSASAPVPTRIPQGTAVKATVPATEPPTSTASAEPNQTSAPTAAAANIPDPAGYKWTVVASGFNHPTDIRSAEDGSGRLFIVEQPGRIRILKNGQLMDAPYLDISDRVGSDSSERGLLGLVFDPKYTENGFFYVNYTDTDGNTHIARFTGSGDKADPNSEKKLIFVQQPFPNHNGGSLAFGAEGYLYIGLGDGGSQGDPNGNAQSGNSLLGKILRIDVNSGDPYSIPADNPYAASGEVYKEIWATGLRNPWRISFDRLTGDMWIGDVGQNLWEEIDFVRVGTSGGLNFGWNKMEATHPFKGDNQPEFTAPVAEYPHGPECSVTGGYVYRGPALPEWQGVYLFGDYCSGAIWGLASPPDGTQPTALFHMGFSISTFGQDEAGELYVADYKGAIYRLEK